MLRVPVYIVCAVIVVAANSEENYSVRELEAAGSLSSAVASLLSPGDQETLQYILPRLMVRYRPNKHWDFLPPLPVASAYYPMSGINSNSIEEIDNDSHQILEEAQEDRRTIKRVGPSLSVSNPLDVLRNRLLLEISRKKEMEGVNRNRNLLCQIGKRAFPFDTKRKCEEPAEKFISD